METEKVATTLWLTPSERMFLREKAVEETMRLNGKYVSIKKLIMEAVIKVYGDDKQGNEGQI